MKHRSTAFCFVLLALQAAGAVATATEKTVRMPAEIHDHFVWTLRARTRTTAAGPVFTRGVTIAGVRVTDTLLTDAVLRVDGAGNGTLRYHSGLSARDPRTPADALANPAEYLKYRWDILHAGTPLESQCVQSLLYLPVNANAWSLPVECPAGAEITQILVRFSPRSLSTDSFVRMTLSTEPFGKGEELGAFAVGPGAKNARASTPKALPARRVLVQSPFMGYEVRMDRPGARRLFISFSGRRAMVGGVSFIARLHYARAPQPAAGSVVWREDKESSGLAELSFETRPTRVLVDAAGRDTAVDVVVGGTPCRALGLRLGGEGQASLVRLNVPGDVDMARFNRLTLRYHVPAGMPVRDLRVAAISFTKEDGRKRRRNYCSNVIETRHAPGWQTTRLRLNDAFRSGRLAEVNFDRRYSRQWTEGDRVELLVKDVYLESAQDTRADADSLFARPWPPERVARFRARIDALLALKFPPRSKAFWETPARRFCPMGVWFHASWGPLARELGMDEWLVLEAMMRELRAHNVDALAANGLKVTTPERLARLIGTAERVGVRLVPYEVYFHDQGSTDANARYYRTILKARLAAMHTHVASRPGVLCWMMTEEIPERMVPDLDEYVADMARLDPTRPATICSNRESASAAFCKRFKPPVILCDRYCYRWTWGDPLGGMAKFLSTHEDAQRPHDGAVWAVDQGIEIGRRTPGGNYVAARYLETGAQMTAQTWVALLCGCTGTFPFTYTFARGELGDGFREGLKDADGRPTVYLKALSDVYARLAPLKGLLGWWTPAGELQVWRKGASGILARPFTHPRAKGRFWIVVNKNHKAPAKVALDRIDAACVDLVTGRGCDRASVLDLGPGEGTILYAGPDQLEVRKTDWSLAGTQTSR